MRSRVFQQTAGRALVLAMLGGAAWLALAGRAQGGPIDDDGVPTGTVAYFTGGACPAGWATATTVQGRLVVGVSDIGRAGVVVGTPLGDREDRAHQHTFTGTVQLGPKGIAGADGPNQSGAAAQDYMVSGTTDSAPSGLPFVQVQPCLKQ
jgi:hypothetical protein